MATSSARHPSNLSNTAIQKKERTKIRALCRRPLGVFYVLSAREFVGQLVPSISAAEVYHHKRWDYRMLALILSDNAGLAHLMYRFQGTDLPQSTH